MFPVRETPRYARGAGLSAAITELRLPGDPAAWGRVGFDVSGERLVVGSVPIRLGAVFGWTLSGIGEPDLDGVPTELVAASAASPPVAAHAPPESTAPLAGPPPLAPDSTPPVEHPIGATRIDHIVVLTPALQRTIGAFERNGIRCRRVRADGGPAGDMRQAFFRLGEVIAEAVEVPGDEADAAARLWGVTFAVADLGAAAARLGGLCAPIRDAVQPGRRIAPLRRAADLGLPVALISD